MKLTLMLWAAALTVQLLAAASLELEEKEMEDALATREVEVERREWHSRDELEMIILDGLNDAFQTLLHYAERLMRRARQNGRGSENGEIYEYSHGVVPERRLEKQRRGRKGRRKGRKRPYGGYDRPPRKRFLEAQGGDAKAVVDEQDAVALCRDFLLAHKVGVAAGKAQEEEEEEEVQEPVEDGKQEEVQEEGQQEEKGVLQDLVEKQKMLELCLELME